MALQTSGKISLLDVRNELKKDGKISLNDSDVRKLAEKEDGEIKLSDFYGKSKSAGDIYMKDVYYEDDHWVDPHPDTNVINLKSIRFDFFDTPITVAIILKIETKSPSITLSENITLYFENDFIGVQSLDLKKQNNVYIKTFTYKDRLFFHKLKLYYDKKFYMSDIKTGIRFHLAKTGVDIGIEDKLGEPLRFANIFKDPINGYYFTKGDTNCFKSKIKIGEKGSFMSVDYNTCKLYIMANRTDFPKILYVVLHSKKIDVKYTFKFNLITDKIDSYRPIEYFFSEQRIDKNPGLDRLERFPDNYVISISQTLNYEDIDYNKYW